MGRNKIIDEKDDQWRKMTYKTVQAYEKRLIAKQQQLDVLIQQQKQYEIENEDRETKMVEKLEELEEEQVRQIEEHAEVLDILSKEQERQKVEHAEVLHQQQIQYEEKFRKLEQERECYRKENENRKVEHTELLQKLSEDREQCQRENEQRKIEYEQMILKIQTSSCVLMDATKNTNEDNSQLRADIKATHDSVNKLKTQARNAYTTIREHFRNENENRKMEHAQLAEFAETTRKNLLIETNFRMLATTTTDNYITRQIGIVNDSFKREIEYVNKRLDTARDYSGKTETTIIQPDIVPPDILEMKTAKTNKRKLDNSDNNRFGDRPS